MLVVCVIIGREQGLQSRCALRTQVLGPIDFSTEICRCSETILHSETDLDSFTSFKARSQGQSIDRPVCDESFCQKQSNSVKSPSSVRALLCKPPALPYQQCTCIGVSMRERTCFNMARAFAKCSQHVQRCLSPTRLLSVMLCRFTCPRAAATRDHQSCIAQCSPRGHIH